MLCVVDKKCDNILCYIDDISVYGATEEQHRASFPVVLRRMKRERLRLNEKSAFNLKRLHFGGLVVSERDFEFL